MDNSDKITAYRKGLYKFTPPPVYCGMWSESDWIRYIDAHGEWIKE